MSEWLMQAIFDIYTSRPFQRYKEHFKARCFDPCNQALKFWESRRTPSSHFWECESHPHTCLKVGLRESALFYEKVTKVSLQTVLDCLSVENICKCFSDGKYRKFIDIILDPQILIIIYEHLKSKPGDIKLKKNIKKMTLEEMSMKWIYWTSKKLEVF